MGFTKKTVITPSSLDGEIWVPPSKSQTMRALVFSLLAQRKAGNRSVIFNPLFSPDVQAMVEACRLLGAEVDAFQDRFEVQGGMRVAEDVIDAGNSGQVLRFIGAVSALLPTYTVFTGDDSIRFRRKVQPLIEGINQLGGWAVSTRGDGYAPMVIRGPLEGGVAEVSGEDSQPVSALLIAAAFAPQPTDLFVKNPGEIPWVELTLSWLDRFKLPYENHNFTHFRLQGEGTILPFEYTVPGDWSSALYPIAAAIATNSEIKLHGVDFNDPQGDKEVVTLLQQMGAKISVDEKSCTVTVYKGSRLQGREIDVQPFIDAVTLLAVLACLSDGPTQIIGASIARFKESNRLYAIVSELKKMGAEIEETAGGITIWPSSLKGTQVMCHSDHRMALSLTVAALAAEGSTEIIGAEVVAKSFPHYFEALQQLGASVSSLE